MRIKKSTILDVYHVIGGIGFAMGFLLLLLGVLVIGAAWSSALPFKFSPVSAIATALFIAVGVILLYLSIVGMRLEFQQRKKSTENSSSP